MPISKKIFSAGVLGLVIAAASVLPSALYAQSQSDTTHKDSAATDSAAAKPAAAPAKSGQMVVQMGGGKGQVIQFQMTGGGFQIGGSGSGSGKPVFSTDDKAKKDSTAKDSTVASDSTKKKP